MYATAHSFCGQGTRASGSWRAWSGPDRNGLKVPTAPKPDEVPACVEGTVATKEQFCFILLRCIILAIATMQDKKCNLSGFCNDFVQY